MVMALGRLARTALALSAAVALAASAPESGAEDVVALAADDECHVDDSMSCSLSALQLKGRQVGATVLNMTSLDRSLHLGGVALPNETISSDLKATVSAQSSFVHGPVVTGYHQTSPDIGELILKSHFKPGHVGYCGGGIYFAESIWATTQKAIGPDSRHGFIIEARIDLGRLKYMGPSCMSPRLGVSTLSSTPTSEFLRQMDADSFVFNPWDGVEYVIADPSRVISMRRVWG